MEPVMETVAARVAGGAGLLDAHLPGWAERVDSGRLDAGSDRDSVLGQLRDQTVSVSGLCAVLRVDQAAHGFAQAPDAEDPDAEDAESEIPSDAAELTGAWHVEITRRTRRTRGNLTVVTAEGVG